MTAFLFLINMYVYIMFILNVLAYHGITSYDYIHLHVYEPIQWMMFDSIYNVNFLMPFKFQMSLKSKQHVLHDKTTPGSGSWQYWLNVSPLNENFNGGCIMFRD